MLRFLPFVKQYPFGELERVHVEYESYLDTIPYLATALNRIPPVLFATV